MKASGIEQLFTLVIVCFAVSPCIGEIQLTQFDRVAVQGNWSRTSDDGFLREIDRKSFDLNGDGTNDLEFTHDYQADTPGGVPIPVAGTLSTARYPLIETGSLLDRIHQLTEQARGGDPNLKAFNQAEIENAVETIRRIQALVSWNGRELFRGDFGVWQESPGEIGQIVDAGLAARSDPFNVNVTTSGERAQIDSYGVFSALFEDETLLLNDVQIRLRAGMNLPQIRDAINRARIQTGAFAVIGHSSEIRILSDSFGFGKTVTANSVSINGGSGVLGDLGTDEGVDAAVSYPPGMAYTGNGNFVKRSDGVVAEIAESSDISRSLSGELNIRLRDGSLDFPFSEDRENTSATIPNLDIDKRGFAGADGQPLKIAELDVTTNSDERLVNFLGSLETAAAEIDQIVRNSDRILDEPNLPAGKAQSFSRSQTRMIGDTAVFALEPGDVIGPDSMWSAPGVMEIAGVEFDTWNIDSRYFGVELTIDGATHYGWLEVSLTEDSGLELIQAAFELEAGVPILAGAVPEPESWCLLFFGSLLIGFVRKTGGCRMAGFTNNQGRNSHSAPVRGNLTRTLAIFISVFRG